MSTTSRKLIDQAALAEFIRDRGPHCLIVARHGETEWNAERRLQGQLDIPLNGRGRSQARATARLLRTVPLIQVHSSSLQRCQETAHSIAEANIGEPNVVSSDLIKETALGILDSETHFRLVFGSARPLHRSQRCHRHRPDFWCRGCHPGAAGLLAVGRCADSGIWDLLMC